MIHRIEVGRINDGTAFPPRRDQTGMAQMRKMKRKVGWGDTEPGTERSSGNPLGTRSDQRPEDT
jgi:hypothetical protein